MCLYGRWRIGGLLVVLLTFVSACGSDPMPKPRGYFRLNFPEKQYRVLDSIFPYRFQYPAYGRIAADMTRGADKNSINLDFPGYKARVHISYKDVGGNLDALIEDSRNLAYKHTIKADAINEKLFSNEENRVYGVLYDIRGDAASSLQFYATDSVRHFIRGALYFHCRPNKDSLAPAVDFFGKDLVHLMETIEWK